MNKLQKTLQLRDSLAGTLEIIIVDDDRIQFPNVVDVGQVYDDLAERLITAGWVTDWPVDDE